MGDNLHIPDKGKEKTEADGAREMAWLLKYLPCKYKVLSPIPRTHIKTRYNGHACKCSGKVKTGDPLSSMASCGKVEIGGSWSSVDSQSCKIHDF